MLDNVSRKNTEKILGIAQTNMKGRHDRCIRWQRRSGTGMGQCDTRRVLRWMQPGSWDAGLESEGRCRFGG